MITSIELRGADTLAATCDSAAAHVADMHAASLEAARIIASAGAAEAPKLTGRLASSLRATSVRNTGTVTSPLVYAVPIHWGRPAHNIAANPFLMRAADRTETQWSRAYETELQRQADTVRGV